MSDNDLITWSNRLECGVKVIDEQHQELVKLVNEMFNHVTGNDIQEHNYFNRVIYEMVNYVKSHFATEERIMLLSEFEGYAEHKREHLLFIRTVVDNIRDYESGKRLTLSSFTKFLKDWILSHIAVMDKQYFIHLRKIATRKEDGRLAVSLGKKTIQPSVI